MFDDQKTENDNAVPASRLARVWRWFRIGLKTILMLFVGYLLIVLIGLMPVNNDFEPASLKDHDAVRIFVQSSDVHADILVPLVSDQVNWLDYFPLKEKAHPRDYMSFGWGERAFYLETPTWGDLTLRKAASAMLLPTESVMHCSIARPTESETCKSVLISAAQYRGLVDYITRSYRRGTSQEAATSELSQLSLDPIKIDRAHIHKGWPRHHHFYKANGSYHALNTCNSWVGGGLKHAGVRAPWLSPMPKSVFLYLPEQEINQD